MKQILLVPDSFKGTLTSRQVCETMAEQLHLVFPEADITSLPVADGGEGSVDAFLAAAGGERVELPVTGPFGEPVRGFYGLLPDGETAVLEMAACAGLPLAEGRLDPERATTYGVGELILDAIRRGRRKVILGLGGSCTNDGGVGAAAALGAKFTRADGTEFLPTGGTLQEIAALDCTPVAKALEGVELVAMCDIDNPLYGENGAAYVFAPQKGADGPMVERLDGATPSGAGGRGAWGGPVPDARGRGSGRLRLRHGGLLRGPAAHGHRRGAGHLGFDKRLPSADLVFTGEGKIDFQSLRGKVVSGVCGRAKRAGVPVIAVVGQIGPGFEPMYDQGLSAVFSVNRAAQPFSESRHHARENLALAMENIARTLALRPKTYRAIPV